MPHQLIPHKLDPHCTVIKHMTVLIETPKVTAWTMLSTIGGSMGLYVGVSVITICELVQFLAESVHYVKIK